ncbi:hypothetical protein [Streptomyces sp. NPDC046759]|uniref:hypothetical protein n=1 Tax=Streptomyces sp. NPDC046759 TaxID=3155019 RepID=UPI0033D2913B
MGHAPSVTPADGPLHADGADLAPRSPGPLGGTTAARSASGPALFAQLRGADRCRARRRGATATLTALTFLTAPATVATAFVVDSGVKPHTAEDRPGRGRASRTPEAGPPRGDRSVPGRRTAVAVSAAAALFFAARPGAPAPVCALATAASRTWAGVPYPHDAVAGAALGGPAGFPAASVLRRRPAGRPSRVRQRPPGTA